ncbi:phosphatidylinositol transfer protein csr1 [Coemansia sp. Benny D115]|nr:phosphatidylinositol transfer protein csr1 [Coemansia sp. Benny D115]
MVISQASIIGEYEARKASTDGCPGYFSAEENRTIGKLWELIFDYLESVKDKPVKVVGEFLQKIERDWSSLRADESPVCKDDTDLEAATRTAWQQFTKGDGGIRMIGFRSKKKLTHEQLVLDRHVNETTQQYVDRAAGRHVALLPDNYFPSFANPSTETRNLYDVFWEAATIKEHPDIWLHRFLRSAGWDADKALGMIKTCLEWRATEAFDVINHEGEVGQGLDELRLGLSQLIGRDRLGYPLMYIRVRRIMPRANEGFVFKRYLISQFEALQHVTRKHGRITMLYDFTGFSMDNTPFSMVQFMVLLGMKQYVEVSGVLILLVDSWLFSNLWNLIRPFLDANLGARIVFAKTVDDVRRFIDDDQLPLELGGSNGYRADFMLPEENENKMLFDLDGRQRAEVAWRQCISQFEEATRTWAKQIRTASDTDATDKQLPITMQRDKAGHELGDAQFRLRKYTWARNNFERLGLVGPDGCLKVPTAGTSK